MRLYSFVMGNYLNSGQHGIQTGHAAVDIAIQDNKVAHVWAALHKTFIILNAYNFAGIKKVSNDLTYLIQSYNAFLVDKSKVLPYTEFYEDYESLNKLQTCFACVLPKEVYEAVPLMRRDDAEEILRVFWNGVENHHAMVHTAEKYLNLIVCTLKGYNLVQL